ncbi:hypothetical protein OG596_39280 (plasmid) [Streptomyces sp. NBC_01102]|uniref:DUF7739 domain-containing protein n=1 Tax=unclassified Streptomyces TaxID=2593676 RepID=UPI00288B2683|nr:hypothetical protein [Streptomyces sp. ITFR-6]WNI34638.1 hypothetical protein RLT59_39115 [Streptomyces sp. ITFR-6]WSU71405.1 hypothetical protein OG596_39280 [Streptomyces sp. NBC_01102]
MSRKHAIHDAEPSVITSHGADFFGEDRHPLKSVKALAPYAENSVSVFERSTVARLLQLLEAPVAQTFSATEAAELSEQLLKVSRDRHLKSGLAAIARHLADAAGRAAAGGEPWTWSVEGSTAAA